MTDQLAFVAGLQTTDENWKLAVIKEAAAVIFKVSLTCSK